MTLCSVTPRIKVTECAGLVRGAGHINDPHPDLTRLLHVLFVRLDSYEVLVISTTLIPILIVCCMFYSLGWTRTRLDSYEVLVISTTLIPIFMLLIPFCSTLWSLVLALAAMGLYMGAVDCLATLNIIQTFEERVAPFLQLMFFCYGIGAFVSPMIAEPYLLNEDCSLVVAEQTNETTDLLPVVPGVLFNNDSDVTEADSLQGARQLSGVSIAFWIMALMQTPVPFIVFSLVLKRRQGGWTRDHRKLVNSQSSDAVTLWAKGDYENMDARTSDVPLSLVNKNCCTSAPSEVLFITFMAASLLFITEGLQSSFGGYVNSFAVQSIPQLNKPEGAYIDACFWGTFALGRLLSIFIATRYHPAHMLLASLVGTLGSTILMLALPHDRLAIYIGTCIFGLFLSSTSPTILSLTEQYIDLNMSTTTVLVVIAAFGEMFCPVVVGNVSETLT
ncbi:Major facilitator superfamily domain-containing protein 4A [Lamellibrachia satsuma]|nr:Major facilitator superfamily domain-containing protein 4A [Lamellibrachia satsuma]